MVMRHRIVGRIIALVTAYAVAIGALVPAFAFASTLATASEAAVLCSGAPIGEGGAPARHDPSCPFGMPCAAHACGGANLPVHVDYQVVRAGQPRLIGFALLAATDPVPLHVIGSHAARAPPEALPFLHEQNSPTG
jgi:hypothetical protein